MKSVKGHRDIELQPACSAWLGRVEQLKADIEKLQAFIETLTPEERSGPLRTVNQVRARGWGIALQMDAVAHRIVRHHEYATRPTRL